MKILSLLLALSIASCSNSPSKKDSKPDVTVLPEVVVTPTESAKPEPSETVVVPGGTETTVVDVVKTPAGETVVVEVVPGQVAKRSDFAVKSTMKVVKQLADLGNCLVAKEKFYNEIKNHKQFDYTKHTSPKVAEELSEFYPVIVTTYYKWGTSTIAYRNVGSNVIYLNTYHLGSKPTRARLNTMWHERSHVVGYGHGDNKAAGKGNSVPYGTGKMSEVHFDECYAEIMGDAA